MFHTYVLMNLFNQINSRKLGATELNVFAHFLNNFYFLLVLLAEFVATFFMVQYGGSIFRTAPLTIEMHIACYSFGFGSLIVGAVLKLTKPEFLALFERVPFKESSHDSRLPQLALAKTGTKSGKGETQKLLDSN